MGTEIERKFLVKDAFPHWRYENSLYYSKHEYRQGYFKNKCFRVRIIDLYSTDQKAFLTIKSKRDGISRYEFEYEIPIEDALQIMSIFCENRIEKTRYTFKENGKIWEVDVFCGSNHGIVMAEVELDSEREDIILPDFIGEEVSNDKRYYNSRLAKRPYCEWKK